MKVFFSHFGIAICQLINCFQRLNPIKSHQNDNMKARLHEVML